MSIVLKIKMSRLRISSIYPYAGLILYMFLNASEMDIQFMKMLQKGSKGRTFCHLSKCVNILRKALTAIAKLTIRTRNIGVRVVNVTR